MPPTESRARWRRAACPPGAPHALVRHDGVGSGADVDERARGNGAGRALAGRCTELGWGWGPFFWREEAPGGTAGAGRHADEYSQCLSRTGRLGTRPRGGRRRTERPAMGNTTPRGALGSVVERDRMYRIVRATDTSSRWVVHVNPSHEVRPATDGAAAYAQFNVETVLPPVSSSKWRSSRKQAEAALAQLAGEMREGQEGRTRSCGPPAAAPFVQATSDIPQAGMVTRCGLGDAMVAAFAEHRPLILSPDSVWSAITYAFGRHVNANTEGLRRNFGSHRGKVALNVDVPDLLAEPANCALWEQRVFAQFAEQIRTHVGDDVHDTIAGPFSTSGAPDIAASQIALMGATAKVPAPVPGGMGPVRTPLTWWPGRSHSASTLAWRVPAASPGFGSRARRRTGLPSAGARRGCVPCALQNLASSGPRRSFPSSTSFTAPTRGT